MMLSDDVSDVRSDFTFIPRARPPLSPSPCHMPIQGLHAMNPAFSVGFLNLFAIAASLFGSAFFGAVTDITIADDTPIRTKGGVYEVVSVTPSQFVLHGVEVQSQIEASRSWVNLRGPRMHSRPVSASGSEFEKTSDYLTWYQIAKSSTAKPAIKTTTMLSVSNPFNTSRKLNLRLGEAKFLLSPAQSITSGPPTPVAETLNLFKAYQVEVIEGQDDADFGKLALPDASGRSEVKLGQPIMVAVPAQQWHHEEQLPIKDASSLLLIYEIDDVSAAKKATIIDQFGLNSLDVDQSSMIAIDARLANDPAE